MSIDSVINQVYDNWELCLYTASPDNATIEVLKKWSGKDSRIKIEFADQNLDISLAENKALNMAVGDYIALLDNGDELNKNALFEVVKKINNTSDVQKFFIK